MARIFGAKSNHVFSLYMGVTNKRDFWHKIIYSKVDALVSSSIKINNEVAENYPIAKEKIHLVRYGRDVKTYVSDESKRNEIRAKYNATPEMVVLGTLARIDEGKGVWELAESAMYLPEELKSKVQIWLIGDRSIVGSGPDGKPMYEKKSEELYEKLVAFIEANQLSQTVKLIGFQKDYIAYLGAMDVFTLLSWDEMYSLSVIDAMFMSLPTIGSDAGGTPEQVGSDRGVLVPIKSPKEVAKQLTLLAQNPQMRQDLGQKAKTWVLEQHSWENVLKRFKELYAGILKQD
ncbi:MAG: glycosyltransferase family 4 protein [Cytophagales bacterium]|nr:glycosyltransferase family 4 protein [Cytophagales bacterium]